MKTKTQLTLFLSFVQLICFKVFGQCPSTPSVTADGPTTFCAGASVTLNSPSVNATVSTLAGSGTAGYTDGTGTAAKFNAPNGIALDASGNLYVADRSNNVIRKISSAGVVSTLAGSGTAGYADGNGTAAKFNGPTGVALDAVGNLYVADAANNRIRIISSAGVVTTMAGGTSGFADGTGTAAKFNQPTGVALDASGNVYVADAGNRRIRKITPAKVVSTFAGSGTLGNADGTGTSAQFGSPRGLTLDASGNMYVADAFNNRIRKVTSAGVVTTLAGSGTAGFADGTGTSADFNGPGGIIADASGNLYVADGGNNRIRKVTSAGVVTTLAGIATAGYTDGTDQVAEFGNPVGVAIDASRNVYVGDAINNCIRKIVQPVPVTGYLWSNGATTQNTSVSTSGSFTLQTIANGCTSAASSATVVTVNPVPNASIAASGSTTLCIGGSVTLTASGGTSYLWSDSSTTNPRTISSAGTYSVKAIANGCTSAASTATVVTVNVCSNAWTGATSNDWADPANWSAGSLPTSTTDVTLSSALRNPIVGGTVTIKSLTVLSGGNLAVNGSLNLIGNLVNNGIISGTGTIKLGGTSEQTVSGTAFDIANLTLANSAGANLNTTVGVSGTLSLTSGTLHTNNNLIIRSNVSGTGLIDDFTSGNTGTLNGTVKIERYFPASGWHLVAAPVTGSTLATLGLGCTSIQNWSEALNTTVPVPSNCLTTNFDINASVFVNQNSGTKYTLAGNANTGDYTCNLVRGTGGNPLIQRGFNNVANPYPSPISWTSVVATSGLTANSNGTAWVYNPATSTWGSISSAGVVTGSANNLIQPGQGLIVRRSTVGMTGATMTFKNSQRVNTNSAFFIRKPNTDQSLRLVLKSDISEDDILLYTSPEANVDADHLDAEKLHSHLPVASISSGSDLAINALPTDFTGTVALNITAPASGLYTLAVKELADVNVTLEDKKTGTFTVLTPETKLDLNLNESNSGRFALHYGSRSATENNTQIFAADKLVTVIIPTADNAVIEAVNTLGQVVSTISSTERVTRFALPHDGVFVIHVKSSNGVKSGKVIY